MRRTIEVSTHLRAVRERVHEVLADDPALVFGRPVAPEARVARRFPAMLGVGLGAGGDVEQAVEVHAGRLTHGDDGSTLPVSWRPTGHARALPSFDGRLVVGDEGAGSRLRLAGSYHVPLGVAGWLIDVLVGRRIARRSLTGFLAGVAERLDAAVDERNRAGSLRPAPFVEDLRE